MLGYLMNYVGIVIAATADLSKFNNVVSLSSKYFLRLKIRICKNKLQTTTRLTVQNEVSKFNSSYKLFFHLLSFTHTYIHTYIFTIHPLVVSVLPLVQVCTTLENWWQKIYYSHARHVWFYTFFFWAPKRIGDTELWRRSSSVCASQHP